MNTNANPLTRREALLNAIKCTVAAPLALPLVAAERLPEPEFVPENDYPFFGCEEGGMASALAEEPTATAKATQQP